MLGDGIRRNIATVSKEERDRYIAAVLKLDDGTDPTMMYSDGKTFFDKTQWAHYAGHGSGGHGGLLGMQWHRELSNRYEALLRAVDPEISLYYWDWTTDPRNQIDSDGNPWSLFSADFLGDDGSAGLNQVPADGGGDAGHLLANFETTVDGSVAFPGGTPQHFPLADKVGHNFLWRKVTATPPVVSADPNLADVIAENAVAPDAVLLGIADTLVQGEQFWGSVANPGKAPSFVTMTFHGHNYIHKYMGGTFNIEHIASRDPIFFLVHSNMDRLYAMWQRIHTQAWRLDPAKLYGVWGTDPTITTESMLPWNGHGGALLGEAPGNLGSIAPWIPGSTADNASLDPGHAVVSRKSTDPEVVIPHSYDTAPHSSYIITNRDTFSTFEVSVITSYPSALFVVYDGFEPNEVGTPTLTHPTITFTDGQTGLPLTSISAVNPSLILENPAPDLPQRVTVAYDIHFTGTSEFPAAAGGTRSVRMHVDLPYTVDTGTGGSVVNQHELSQTNLLLVNQPNPYMIDVQGGNPYWLSVDTRVFQKKATESIAGVTQLDIDGGHPEAANDFIKALVAAFNAWPAGRSDPSHPFTAVLSQDETTSQLELSRMVSGQRVYNYAVAKVRYVAPATVDATDVRVFFRAFSTLVSALDYDHTSGPNGNYLRSGSGATAAPLLGIQNGEIASIPFFAAPRIDTSAVSMTTQVDDVATNTQTITGSGGEQVAYFGCWLDINLDPGDAHAQQFPLSPSADPGGPTGPFTGSRQTIQTLVRGHHQCLVAEVYFQPAGTDPIPIGSSPGSSDRLAQRNLGIIESGNPSYPDTHTVQHTFLVKPSSIGDKHADVETAKIPVGRKRRGAVDVAAAAAVAERVVGPDELIVLWRNVPRDSVATFYLPEIDAEEILGLEDLRQHPAVLEKVDPHTLRCTVADVSYIPLPGGRTGNLAGLLTVTLPPGVQTGQVYKFSVQQYSGITRKVLGAFQVTIPVKTDPEILPTELRKLSVMRYIQQSIPVGNRWYPIFERYVDQIARRVRGVGGDPDAVKPSPDGGEGKHEGPGPCPEPSPARPPDFWCLPIPWSECDLEGEIDVRIRFRRKC